MLMIERENTHSVAPWSTVDRTECSTSCASGRVELWVSRADSPTPPDRFPPVRARPPCHGVASTAGNICHPTLARSVTPMENPVSDANHTKEIFQNPEWSSPTSPGATCKASVVSETPASQAQPIPGRDFPLKAKGARPTFFDDNGATDAVISIVTSLAAEVWALQERIDSLESVLEANGALQPGQVEAHRPTEAQARARADAASAFTSRVFRVFEEMREEIVAGETTEQYQAVVQRAFDEL